MPKVTLAFEFQNEDEARNFLNRAPAIGHLTSANNGEEHVKAAVHHEPKAERGTPFGGNMADDALDAPQPVAPAGKTATFEDCAKSFQAHVQRGQGRSAMTARAAIIKAIPHYTSFKALSPEECATAIDVMDAA